MNNFKIFFDKNGYVVIPKVVCVSKIKELRDKYEFILSKYNALTITPSQFINELSISEILFSDTVINGIKNVISSNNYNMYPDFTIRQSLYIPWHTDVSYLDENNYELEKSADFIQC